MKYFCTNSERKSSIYHEFQKGNWDGRTFWKDDSLYLYDDTLYNLNIDELFIRFIPNYDVFSETEVNESHWNEICKAAIFMGGEVKAVIDEADVWVKETFSTYSVFTIIGI